MTNQNIAIANTARLERRGIDSIIASRYLSLPANDQTYKSMAGQRLTFLPFHRYMYSLSDAQLHALHHAYKHYIARHRIHDDDFAYVDLMLLRDAIHYQLAIRSHDGFDIEQVGKEIRDSWRGHQSLARDYPEVDSDGLIDLARSILSDYDAT